MTYSSFKPNEHHALWKYVLFSVLIILGVLYTLPNLYGEYPSVQIRHIQALQPLTAPTIKKIDQALQQAKLPVYDKQLQEHAILYRFTSTDTQLHAQAIIQAALGRQYLVALNLSPATPRWLQYLGAAPMKLGLDLRGGIHFLLQIDTESVLHQYFDAQSHNIMQTLRHEHVHYKKIQPDTLHNQITVQFETVAAQKSAQNLLAHQYLDFAWQPLATNPTALTGSWSLEAQDQRRHEIVEQAMHTLQNRVNELGISEAIIQQQGLNRVAIDLPGIQDTATAKNILGKTATLELHLVDTTSDPTLPFSNPNSNANVGTRLLYYQNKPVSLRNQVILRGSSIMTARAAIDDKTGQPEVEVRLNGKNSFFTQTTAASIGQPLAIVMVEVQSTPSHSTQPRHATAITYRTQRQIISIATITVALDDQFRIIGLPNYAEARTLALLLRAGALPAPVTIIAERQIGPSLGQKNIHMGLLSVTVGMLFVIIFMALYYGLMGIIADVALVLNLLLIVAILSLLGATLTLPGIAGIVLTVGMAVDANVLIFERIREELRRGMSIHASVAAGYDRAFTTIWDANLTTLIVMIILFWLGSTVVKGIAVTVTIGLLTSMITAITGTRLLVQPLYGQRLTKRISIGL